MFAVIRTGGKQYRVAPQDKLKIDKIAGAPGDIVEFGEVLVVGGETAEVGAPHVAGAAVAAKVLEQGRHATVIAFKKRRRKNSRRRRGQRQEYTLVRITEILTGGRKPSLTAEAGEAAPVSAVQPVPESGPEPAGGPEPAAEGAQA